MAADANIRTSPVNSDDPDGSIAMQKAGMKPRTGLRDAINKEAQRQEMMKSVSEMVKRPGGTGLILEESEKTYKKGGKVSSASSRGDGCAQRGKTKGRML
jgi:hypothetical protein